MEEKFEKEHFQFERENIHLELFAEELPDQVNYSNITPYASWGSVACFGCWGSCGGTASSGSCAG